MDRRRCSESWLNAAAAVETIISPPLSRNGNTAAFPPKEERYSKLRPIDLGLGFFLKNVLLKLCGETVKLLSIQFVPNQTHM